MVVSSAKSEMRERMRQALRGIPPWQRARESQELAHELWLRLGPGNGRVVAAFRSLAEEPDLEPWLELWSKSGGVVVWPKVEGENLGFHRPLSEAAWQRGKFGVWEPVVKGSVKVEVGQLDVVLVPGLAFSPSRDRLGRGGGFYDRLLSNSSLKAMTVGVGIRAHWVEEVPRAAHDQRPQFVALAGDWW